MMADESEERKPLQERQLEFTNLEELQMGAKRDEESIKRLEDNEGNIDCAMMERDISRIFELVTPYGLSNCVADSLSKSIMVSYDLKSMAKIRGGPQKDDIITLGNSVEEFAWNLMEFSVNKEETMRILGDNFDPVLELALEKHNKKFLSHPLVYRFLLRKWFGRYFYMRNESTMWGFGSVAWLKWVSILLWMFLDVVLFPIVFLLLYLLSFCKSAPRTSRLYDAYKSFFQVPFFIFFRDVLSYLALVFLHFVVSVQTTGPRLSVLEWIIMVFFIGRVFMEIHQFCITDSYKLRCGGLCSKMVDHVRDTWNLLDVICIFIYMVLFTIRLIAWHQYTLGYNNTRLVSVGAYLYGLNVIFLTFRVCGELTMAFLSTGVIQIALFKILKTLLVVAAQFAATILAFSFAIHKVFSAGTVLAASSNSTSLNSIGICEGEEGIACWWRYAKHLTWSLVGAGGGVDGMDSPDDVSHVIGLILYILFLIIAAIMLMNMLIALLTNTYQKVEDNSLLVWWYNKAKTIRTYSSYHPVPVPFNIVSLTFLLFYNCCRKRNDAMTGIRNKEHQESFLRFRAVIKDLENDYFAQYGNSFPITDQDKLDQVVKETKGNRHLTEHIAENVFKFSAPTGSFSEWRCRGISVEGQKLSYVDCVCSDCLSSNDAKKRPHVARHVIPLSKQRPGFEVLITENGRMRCLAIGIVQENHNLHKLPGWSENTVGYHIDDGKTFDKDTNKHGKEWTDALAFRGDLIGCEAMFDHVNDRGLPVRFTRNGSFISEGYLEYDHRSTFYPCVGMGEAEITVLFRMRCTSPCDSTSLQLSGLSDQVSSLTQDIARITDQLNVLLKGVQVTLPPIPTPSTYHDTLINHFLIDISGDDLTVKEKTQAMQMYLMDTRIMRLGNEALHGDNEHTIVIKNQKIESHMCWTAHRAGKMIVPPMSLGQEGTMADNLNRLLRYEAALQLAQSPAHQREALPNVDLKVKKIENVKPCRAALQKKKQILEGLQHGVDLTGRDPGSPILLQSHMVDKESNKLKPGTGDGFVFEVSNNDDQQPVYVTVLLFQFNGAVNIIHPSNKNFESKDLKIDAGKSIADLEIVYIPSNSLRRMAEPDLSKPMPSEGADILVVYASTEPVDLVALTQTQIKLDPNLIPEGDSDKEKPLSDYQDFMKTVDTLLGKHNKPGSLWMVKKCQLVINNSVANA